MKGFIDADDRGVEAAAQPLQKDFAGGKAASTPGPRYELIPTVGLERLADRFELGIHRKGDKAWNAVSGNQEILQDFEFLIDRCGHVIAHALKLRDKLQAARSGQAPFEIGDDDAGAIAWAGVFLICGGEAVKGTVGLVGK